MLSRVLFEISDSTFAHYVALMFVVTFVTCYVTYCIQGDGKIFLPTLSETWDFEPGNFISRWVVGTGCVGLHMIVWIIHCAGTADGKYLRFKQVLRMMAQLAVFFLSVVGAVCSSEVSPECQGNSAVHYFAAISFFVLYDVYMGCLLFLNNKMTIPMVVVLVLYVCARSSAVFDTVSGFPYLAVFEWVDVATIITFTATFVATLPLDLRLCLVDTKSDILLLDKSKTVWNMDSILVNEIALRYAFGTLASCLVTSLVVQTIPDDQIPFISDTFVFPPGNYISRWGGILGCTYLQLSLYPLYLAYREMMESKDYALVLYYLSAIGAFGLSAVMVVSETEDKGLHFAGAIAFFILFDIFIILLLISLNQKVNASLAVLVAVTVITKSRLWTDNRNLAAFLEWMDAIIILGFLIRIRYIFPERLQQLRYVIKRN